MEEDIIGLKIIKKFRENPILWDNRLAEYFMSQATRNKILTEFALELGPGFTAEKVEKRFRTIRNSYTTNKRKIADWNKQIRHSKPCPRIYKYAAELSFIEPLLHQKTPYGLKMYEEDFEEYNGFNNGELSPASNTNASTSLHSNSNRKIKIDMLSYPNFDNDDILGDGSVIMDTTSLSNFLTKTSQTIDNLCSRTEPPVIRDTHSTFCDHLTQLMREIPDGIILDRCRIQIQEQVLNAKIKAMQSPNQEDFITGNMDTSTDIKFNNS